jgi:hypothetical protein
MAYENGREVVNYMSNCIEKYKKDPLIFFKTSQLLNNFIARSDWPHCFSELNNVTKIILGYSIEYIILDFMQKYFNNSNMVWPEDLPESFKQDLQAFSITVTPLIEQACYGRSNPLRYHSVIQTRGNFPNEIVRIVRMDGKYLDISMNQRECAELVEILKSLKFY